MIDAKGEVTVMKVLKHAYAAIAILLVHIIFVVFAYANSPLLGGLEGIAVMVMILTALSGLQYITFKCDRTKSYWGTIIALIFHGLGIGTVALSMMYFYPGDVSWIDRAWFAGTLLMIMDFIYAVISHIRVKNTKERSCEMHRMKRVMIVLKGVLFTVLLNVIFFGLALIATYFPEVITDQAACIAGLVIMVVAFPVYFFVKGTQNRPWLYTGLVVLSQAACYAITHSISATFDHVNWLYFITEYALCFYVGALCAVDAVCNVIYYTAKKEEKSGAAE